VIRQLISIVYYSTIHLHGWIVLFCAGILVIFHADSHEVDEDMMSTPDQGGEWYSNTLAGIMYRNTCDSPTRTFNNVASRYRHWKLIIYYTDSHDVDEDKVTIVIYGGYWITDNIAGIGLRGMWDSPSTFDHGVASSNVKNSQIIRMRTRSTKI